jgi:hypothetical protein
MHDACTPKWYRLVPDEFGQYITGSWDPAPLPDMQGDKDTPNDGYGPLFYASAVLPDGRLIVQGGELEFSDPTTNGCNTDSPLQSADSKKGSLYNPFTSTAFTATSPWSPVKAPDGWDHIGDAPSVLLGPNSITGGLSAASYMIGNVIDPATNKQYAVATIAPIPGTNVTWTVGATGKQDPNSEEGWTLLPNGQVLTVDTGCATPPGKVECLALPTGAERFDPSVNMWKDAGNTPRSLTLQICDGKPATTCNVPEIGAAVSIGSNMVVQFGGNSSTAIFTYPPSGDSFKKAWTPGPNFPLKQEQPDGPAALLPNGNILVQTSYAFSGTVSGMPSLFWEFPSSVLTPQKPHAGKPIPVDNPPCNDTVNTPPKTTNVAAFQGRMLVLPTGDILWDAGQGVNCTSVYTPIAGSPNRVMRPAPQITKISNATLGPGNTNYLLTGSMFRDVSQGASYGDDAQMATNYPMVRITNKTSKKVCWGRTHDWADPTSTQFDVPPPVTPVPAAGWPLYENPCDPGLSTLVVITNGLISNSMDITIIGSGQNLSNLTLRAVPSLVRSGSTTNLTWASTNMTKCSVSGNNGDHWPTDSSDPALQSPTGGETSSPITAQTIFTLTCLSVEGLLNSKSVTVNIAPVFNEP